MGHGSLLAVEVDRQAGNSSLEEHVDDLSCIAQSAAVVAGGAGI